MYIRNVGFLEATRLGFQKYFQFSGRAQRAEYWWFALFCLIGSVILMVFDVVVLGVDDPSEDFSPLSDLFSLATLIPSLSLGWRRMHDIGKSGWWSVLWLAPVIWAAVAALTLFSSEGDFELIGAVAVGLGVLGTIAALIYVLVLLIKDSDPYDNRYGQSVKYDPKDDVF
jgi:uncharacterized membrane protein YhaH (DUF805 family)